MMRIAFGVLASILVLSVCPAVFAQDTNLGATVVAPFVATPPTIDGSVSAGEWDAAGVAEGTWSAHDSATEATLSTSVKVLYSIDAIYFLYECEDPNVQSLSEGTEYYGGGPAVEGQADSTFGWAGETDYVALYLDPANYADGNANADAYSYSIQWEPSITAKGEQDSDGNSYFYTELGRWGGFLAFNNPPVVDTDGVSHYFMGGVAWQGSNIQIVDGPTDSGFICEVKIPWASFSGYYRRNEDAGFDLGDGYWEMQVNGERTDPYMAEYGSIKTLEIAEDGTVYTVGSGIVTGMPLPGTVWKAQFCRFSNGDLGYANWVGDTGGFVSRPFGNIEFGAASGSDVANAMLY